MKKYALIYVFILWGLLHLRAQQDIASARSMPLGSTVTISGIVTNGGELGMIRYVQDQSAGIAVYSAEMSGVQRGDSVSLSGTLKDYLSLLELDPVSSVTVHSSGHKLPDPVLLTPGQFSESYEGMLVRVDSGFETLEDMEGATICTTTGTTTEMNLADNFRMRGIEYTPLLFESTVDTKCQTFCWAATTARLLDGERNKVTCTRDGSEPICSSRKASGRRTIKPNLTAETTNHKRNKP